MIKFLMPLSKGSKDVRNRFGKKPVDLLTDATMRKDMMRGFSQRKPST
jgi:hypothetical protein